jgi:lysophospholipase L1-like esterase
MRGIIVNIFSRLMVAGGIALTGILYPFLERRLTTQGVLQDVAFHVAYVLTMVALAGGVVTVPYWFEAGLRLLKSMPVRSFLLLFNLFFSSVIFLSLCTQWGVIVWMLMGSLLGIRYHFMKVEKRFIAFEKIVQKSLISFGCVYLALCLGELYFRIYPEQVGRRGGEANPAFRAIYKGLYSTNIYGLRGDDFDLVPSENTYRILVLGDSFTYGCGARFEDTFPKQAELLLNARGDKTTFEVINAGKPGLNTLEEMRYLKAEGWKFQPDLVVVQFYANDLQATVEILEEQRNKFIEIFFKKPFRKSYVFFFLRRNFNEFNLALLKLLDDQFPKDYLWGLHQTITFNSSGWKQCSSAYVELAKFSKEKSLPVMVVLFPHPGEPHGAIPLIHETVGAFCKKQGLPVLDLLEDVKAIPPARQVVRPFDDHPSEEYHRLAAKRLVEALDHWALLPR